MKKRIERFIRKHGICPTDILYIIRSEKKTCIHMAGGRVFETYFSLKNLLSVFGEDTLVCINKGVAVSCTQVESIEDGIYIMSDGKQLRGRVRTPGQHKRNLALVTLLAANEPAESDGDEPLTPLCIEKRFSILDDLPIPFVIFEGVYDDDGVPKDIVFRYLNHKMTELVEKTPEEVLGRSFYDVFENGDPLWLEIDAGITSGEKSRSVQRFSPEVGRYLSVYHYRPLPGFIACALI